MLPDPVDIHCVDRVQALSSNAGTRFNTSLDDEVVLQLEFEKRKNIYCKSRIFHKHFIFVNFVPSPQCRVLNAY